MPRRKDPTKTTVAKTSKKAAATKPASLKTTYVALVIDASGSMSTLASKARDSVNEQMKALAAVPKGDPTQRVFYTIVAFDTTVEVMVPPQNIANSTPMVSYPVRGYTALRDGVKRGAEELKSFAAKMSGKDDDVAFLVVTFTDGEENKSFTTLAEFKKLMADCEAAGNWTFTFQLPPRTGDAFAAKQGVSRDNVREWEQTAKGMEEATSANTDGFRQYFAARSVGVQSVKTFYQPVTADLSKVKVSAVKKQLDDLSGQFKSFQVGGEEEVKEFVEGRTRRPYVIGSAFYQLTKRELVQPTKRVLVSKRGDKHVYGGDQARELIGLPTDGKTSAKVEVGNLGDWEVFIASTSVNRKLVRGTRVLVDVTKTKDDSPTWRHDLVDTTK